MKTQKVKKIGLTISIIVYSLQLISCDGGGGSSGSGNSTGNNSTQGTNNSGTNNSARNAAYTFEVTSSTLLPNLGASPFNYKVGDSFQVSITETELILDGVAYNYTIQLDQVTDFGTSTQYFLSGGLITDNNKAFLVITSIASPSNAFYTWTLQYRSTNLGGTH